MAGNLWNKTSLSCPEHLEHSTTAIPTCSPIWQLLVNHGIWIMWWNCSIAQCINVKINGQPYLQHMYVCINTKMHQRRHINNLIFTHYFVFRDLLYLVYNEFLTCTYQTISSKVTLSSSALGSIMGLQSAEIQQMAMEYEEKVTTFIISIFYRLILSFYCSLKLKGSAFHCILCYHRGLVVQRLIRKISQQELRLTRGWSIHYISKLQQSRRKKKRSNVVLYSSYMYNMYANVIQYIYMFNYAGKLYVHKIYVVVSNILYSYSDFYVVSVRLIL